MQNKSIAGLENFLNKCDELINAKFILAGAKISELLGSIALSKPLFKLFEKVLDEFNYAKFKEANLVQSKDNTNRGVIILPDSAKDKIALIFCLLMDIETGKIEFGKFLQKYFYTDGSYFESFYAFSNSIIKPFKSIVKAAAEEICQPEKTKKKSEFGGLFLGENYKEANNILNDAKNVILSTGSLTSNERVDICKYIDLFLSAVLELDKELIKILQTGLRYMADNIVPLQPFYKKIENLLKNQ